MRSVELFVNFPIQDMNRNVLRHDTSKVEAAQVARMTRFWGDNSWREAAYSSTGNLFGFEEKQTNDDMVRAYRRRLKEVAGFSYVPEPLPMRNSQNAVVYYLFFASPNDTGRRIVQDIFRKWSQ